MEASKKRKSNSDGSSKKRLKARVGKRALQPANVTDTRFRAASLAVKKQVVDSNNKKKGSDEDDDSSTIILSSRGKSLEELTAQLHHTAASARHSAVRGIANALDISSIRAVQASLATLIPTVSKCCIDEDEDVRNSGLVLLQDLLKKASSPTTTNTSTNVANGGNHNDIPAILNEATANSTVDVLRPFVSLITAYATSALTSLDRATRFDGGRFVQILCTNIPTLLTANQDTILQLLHPYIGLLSDHISNQTNRLTCLRSLTSLLRIAATGDSTVTIDSRASNLRKQSVHRNNSQNINKDFVRCVGGKCSNAIFMSGLGCRRRYVRPLKSVHDLSQSQFTEDNYVRNKNQNILNHQPNTATTTAQQQANNGGEIATCRDLMKKLYGVCVELFERRKTDMSEDNGYCLDVTDMEELSQLTILLSSFLEGFGISQLLFLQAQSQHYHHQQQKNEEKEKKKKSKQRSNDSFDEVCTSLLTLLFNAFPIHGTSLQKETISRYEAVNSNLCHLLIDLGSTLERNSKTPSWIGKVLVYTLSNIDIIADTASAAATSSPASSNGGNDGAIDVTAKLLLLQDADKEHILDDKTRCVLLKKIRDCYFADDAIQHLDVARSAGGQRAATLVCSLLTILDYNLNDIPRSMKTQVILRDMVQKLPLLLYAWDIDYPSQTSAVWKSLTNVVRCFEQQNNTTPTQQVVDRLRNNIGHIFVSGRKKSSRNKSKSKTLSVVVSEKGSEKSVFERYPGHIQRQVISLIGSIQEPSTETMDGLLRFCTRKCSNTQGKNDGNDAIQAGEPDVFDFIIYTLYTIRRSMSMQKYLGFIIGLTGIGKRKQSGRESSSSSLVTTSKQDMHRLRSTCRSLCRSGGIKTLPMITPALSMWFDRTYNNIEDDKKNAASAVSKERLAGAVAVTSILASLFSASRPSTTAPGIDGTFSTTGDECLDHLSPFKKPLALALRDILLSAGADNENSSREEKLQAVGPFVTLTDCCPKVLSLVTKYISHDICEVDKSYAKEEDWNTEVMNSLLLFVERLDEVFASNSGLGGEIATSLLDALTVFRTELTKPEI